MIVFQQAISISIAAFSQWHLGGAGATHARLANAPGVRGCSALRERIRDTEDHRQRGEARPHDDPAVAGLLLDRVRRFHRADAIVPSVEFASARSSFRQGARRPACRFPFKLSLLIFQLALVTLSMCHRARGARVAYPPLLCQAATPQRLSRVARWPAGGDSLNGSNARLCQLKGPKTRDGPAPPEGHCERMLAAERP